MSKRSTAKDLSLKSLEVFQLCATEGSFQAAANVCGVSISTVSHHIRNLEDHLGVALFDHTRRPIVLTARGRSFLNGVQPALQSLRTARAEAQESSAAETRHLRFGAIEDLDSDVFPALGVYMSRSLPSADLSFHTDTSQTLLEMLRKRQLDIALTTRPTDRIGELKERPLLRDPFVVILPAGAEESLSDIVEGRVSLPFLRFSSNLIIARQIEAQLKRVGMLPTHRFECSNNQTIMAMVAAGFGWSISTPLLFARAKRFHRKVRMHRFPGKSFSRTLSLVATPECSQSVSDLVFKKTRTLLERHMVSPLLVDARWLRDEFRLTECANVS